MSITGIARFCWPDPVTTDGQIDRGNLQRRIETVLACLGPSMALIYGAFEYGCHCPDSGMMTFLCCFPIPAIFAQIDESRAEARINPEIQKKTERCGIPATPPAQLASPRVNSTLKTDKTPSGTCRRRTVITTDCSDELRYSASRYPLHPIPELIGSRV